MKNKTVYFKVGIKRPVGLTDADLREYIKDAVSNWNKGGDPMSPLWDIDRCTVSKLPKYLFTEDQKWLLHR